MADSSGKDELREQVKQLIIRRRTRPSQLLDDVTDLIIQSNQQAMLRQRAYDERVVVKRAVQKALEGLLEQKIEMREPFFDPKVHAATAVVPVSAIESTLAATQPQRERNQGA